MVEIVYCNLLPHNSSGYTFCLDPLDYFRVSCHASAGRSWAKKSPYDCSSTDPLDRIYSSDVGSTGAQSVLMY